MGFIIKDALVVEDPVEGIYTNDLAVLIEGDLVDQVGPLEQLSLNSPDAIQIDGSGMMLLPGLIDAHTHLYAALTLGMPYSKEAPRNFPQILKRVWWPFDKALREDDLQVSAQIGSIASLRSGITTMIDHHSSPSVVSNSLSRIAAGIESIGLRACLAYEVSDRDGKDIFEGQIKENIRFAEEVSQRKNKMMASLFGMHAVFSLSDDSLRLCADEANNLGLGCHMHMVEHLTEKEKFASNHDVSITEFLAELEILGPKTLVAHTVHIDETDILILKDTGTFNVHNPQSNMGNGVGIAPVKTMLELGQPVGLGSDGFYDLSIQLTLARLLQTLNTQDPSGFSEVSSLKLAYENNAKYAERLYDIPFGKVKKGFAADLILVSYSPSTPIENWNIHSHILAALNCGKVNTSLIGGKIVMEDNVILGVDEAEIRLAGHHQANRLWARL
jgi:putative selenium metabolism protein SsnA